MFQNQVTRKRKRESQRKKERMRAGFTGMFLNEGEKENKRRGGRDSGHMCGGEKKKRKKK